MDNGSTDWQLIERIQGGDKRAFDLLVIKYQRKIMTLVSSYVNNSHEVQDIAQESFIKAYRALGKFRGDSTFYTWLYRIAINTAKNHLVAKGRRPPESDIDAYDTDSYSNALKEHENPEGILRRDQMEKAIHDVIRSLPNELRTALTLREFDGLSYEEIAHIMGCPMGTVRSRIFRAREAIEKVIRPIMMEG